MELTVDQTLQQAVAAHNADNLQEAERLYRSILEAQPKHPDANHNLGLIAAAVNQSDAALALFKTAVEANTGVEQFWLTYIEALIIQGEFNDAKRALKKGKKKGVAKENLKMLAQKLESVKADALAVQAPSQAEMQELMNHYQNGRYGDAEVLALSITKQFPNHPFSYNALGGIYKQAGRSSELVIVSKKVVVLSPEDAGAHCNLGLALKEAGRLEEAELSYKRALKLNPGLVDAYKDLGNVLKEMEKSQEAETCFRQAIALEPDYVGAHSNLGVTLQELGRLDEAEASFKQAIALKADYAEAHYNLGNTLKELGRLEEAEVSYKQAIALKPEYANANSNLAVTLQELGRLDEAKASYRKAIALKPNIAETHNNLGVTLKDLGRLDESEISYRQAIALKPGSAETHNNLGVTLQEQGRLEEAIDEYNKSLSINPGFSEAWNNIAFSLQAIKTQLSSDVKLRSFYPEDTNSKYGQIEKSILKYKLHLVGENAGNYLNEALRALAGAENITIKNPSGGKGSAGLDLKLPNKVVVMMHFGRSGTGLLHSLIDGHSEVSTLPSIYLSQYFLHSNWEKIIFGGWAEMANRFVAIYEVLFNAVSTVPIETMSKKLLYNIGQKEGMANVGDHKNEVLSVDKTLFCAELNHLISFYDELDAFVFFKLVHAAYDKAINDLNPKSLLFYHIHNPDTYAQLNFLRSSPDGQGIIMVREPLQSCESWTREDFLDNDHTKISTRILNMLFDVDSSVYLRHNTIGIRLEDIKNNPRQTISAICNWVGIKETESVYKMTAQGKKWWGDPSSPDFKISGMDPFGKTSINRKVGSMFSEQDQFIIRTLFYPFSERFGYMETNFDQFKVDLQAIRPMLDQMFDFEAALVKRKQIDPKQFMKSSSYLHLRSGLVERWNTLAEFHTYPNMIEPLKVKF